MEAIGVASSIAGLVSLADVIVLKISKFYSLAKSARSEIKELLFEVQSLYGVLQSLWLLARCIEQNHDPLEENGPNTPRMERFQTCQKKLSRTYRSCYGFTGAEAYINLGWKGASPLLGCSTGRVLPYYPIYPPYP